MIWRFHRFSPSVLKEVYPNSTESTLNNNSMISLLEAEKSQPAPIIGLSMAPVDRLARYLEYVCKVIADDSLKEAEACKHEFLEMPMGNLSGRSGLPERNKSGMLNTEQKRAWEDYWMEQMR